MNGTALPLFDHLSAVELKQIFCQLIQAADIALRHFQNFRGFLGGVFLILPQRIQIDLNRRQRCFQLMGGVRGKAFLPLKSVIQPRDHLIEGSAEFRNLADAIFF